MPITFDAWTAMRKGPLLSTTYNILKEPGTREGYWQTYIQTQGYDVLLTHDPGDDDLSEAEVEIISGVFEEYRRVNQWDMVEVMHRLPEWKSEWDDPDFTSSVPISYEDVLVANGATTEEINTLRDLVETQNLLATSTSKI